MELNIGIKGCRMMELILVPNDVELYNYRMELILVPNDVELNNDRMELILYQTM